MDIINGISASMALSGSSNCAFTSKRIFTVPLTKRSSHTRTRLSVERTSPFMAVSPAEFVSSNEPFSTVPAPTGI